MRIDCPDCGGCVEPNQNNIIPYHDNGSPIVCAGSGRQVSAAFLSDPAAMLAIINGLHARVAELEESDELARAEEREACAAEANALLESVQREIDTTYPTGDALRELVAARTVLAKALDAIHARSKGGA